MSNFWEPKYPNLMFETLFAVIGASGLFQVQIRRRIGRDVIAKIGRPNLLNDKVPVKFVLEITKNGLIALYSSHDPFTPLIVAHDPNPLPIKYLSFASKNSFVQYYIMCTDDIRDTPNVSLNLSVGLPLRFAANLVAGIQMFEAGVVTHKLGLQSCKHVQVQGNEYRSFIPLKDIIGEQNENEIINLPLFIQGDKNAHIALTSTDKPNWETDNIYEFVFGASDNNRIVVRRRKNGEVFADEEITTTISKIIPTKFTISITPYGNIFVFSDLSAYKPLIWASDPDPLPIKYISFASNQSESIDFYYGCPQFTQQLQEAGKVAPLITQKLITIGLHPLLENPLLYDDIDLKALTSLSKTVESWTNSFDSFIEVKDIWRPRGFMLRFVFYIQSHEGANIWLSTEPRLGVDHSNDYEIRLGSQDNTLSQIVRKASDEVLAEIRDQNILSEVKPLRVVIEISNGKCLPVIIEIIK